jgi:phosphoserine phosphatase
MFRQKALLPLIALLLLWPPAIGFAQRPPLSSWNEGDTKTAILEFVSKATREGTAHIPLENRIAVFDDDGTLWPEQPVPFELAFALERVHQLAPKHPAWKTAEPFQSLLAGDVKAVLAGGERAVADIIAEAHAGMTPEEFSKAVAEWIASTKHPRFQQPYIHTIYRPMFELLAYLRANGFRTFLVSAGGAEFRRAWAQPAYHLRPEQVVGSTVSTRFEMRDGAPTLIREAQVDFIGEKQGKPLAIEKFIGQQPVFTFGNSDGDLEMLQWTAQSPVHFVALIHHTDGTREWAYDRKSPIGKLDKALDEAKAKGWTVVDMKRDWKQVWPFSTR